MTAVELLLIRIDYFRDRPHYVSVLREWLTELEISNGRLITMGNFLLLFVAATEAQNDQLLAFYSSREIDSNSRGERCVDKFIDVLGRKKVDTSGCKGFLEMNVLNQTLLQKVLVDEWQAEQTWLDAALATPRTKAFLEWKEAAKAARKEKRKREGQKKQIRREEEKQKREQEAAQKALEEAAAVEEGQGEKQEESEEQSTAAEKDVVISKELVAAMPLSSEKEEPVKDIRQQQQSKQLQPSGPAKKNRNKKRRKSSTAAS
ncbi:hypothetical protein BBJ29_008895 [Phytophthora kernoviae]|uniref:Uncharacterized protein n=1 Tax=Phytophthora kernoviae TaxID=325452 RepID=A0A3F2RFB9_9STRA|nr:hypothetical protein BBJ29_008895 [Phytophthora kernoviae]RLN55538.1 hypothetical protein BBP00_00008447 [Phytophthora kernoviae]